MLAEVRAATLPLERGSVTIWANSGPLVSACMFRVESKLRFIEPQLASPVDQPPEGKQWIHEIKHDGFRCQVLLERGWARVFTRNGHDWSDRYSSIVRAGI